MTSISTHYISPYPFISLFNVKSVQVLGAGDSVKMSTIDEIKLSPGENIPFKEYPEEKIYYFLSGRGLMSVYAEGEFGDIYEIRQDTAVWITPGLGHSVENKGHLPLRFIVINALEREGEKSGRPGHKVTRVFDGQSNPSRMEGLHLMIRPIQIGNSQRFLGAEVNTIAAVGTSRPHIHDDTEENNYILVGEGVFHDDDEEIPCGSGDARGFPPGANRRLENKGAYPLSYINYVTYA